MTKKITVSYASRIEFRKLVEFQRAAVRFKSRVMIQKGKFAADAKSFIEILPLLDAKGKKLEITIEGEDAEQAAGTFYDLLGHRSF